MIDITNNILYQLNEDLVVISIDYWNPNLSQAQEREYLGDFGQSKQVFEEPIHSGFSKQSFSSQSQEKFPRNYNKRNVYYQ